LKEPVFVHLTCPTSSGKGGKAFEGERMREKKERAFCIPQSSLERKWEVTL